MPFDAASESDALTQQVEMVTPELIGSLIVRLGNVLGILLDDLKKTDEKGLRSRTPAKQRHRLVKLLRSAELTASNLRERKQLSSSEVCNLVEFKDAVDLIEALSSDPVFPSVIKSIRNQNDYPHTIVAFAAARYMTYDGYHAKLYDEPKKSKRAADLRIVVPLQGYIAVEVKTPLELQDRKKSLQGDRARSVLKEAINSANVASGGQLDNSAPGVLLLGCFSLSDKDTNLLVAEARHLFYTKSLDRYGHIMGILVLNFSCRTSMSSLAINDNAFAAQNNSSSIFTFHMARNPNYSGGLCLE